MNKCAGHSPSRVLGLLLGLAIATIAGPSTAVAQSVSGTILGTVTDASGSVLSSAKITVVNEGTGFSRTVKADTNGEYTVPQLPTGRYTVTSEMTGFKTTALSNVEVRRRSTGADRSQAGSRRDVRIRERRSHRAAAADVLVRAGHHGHRRADRSPSPERPQFRQPDANCPRRASRHPGREHRRRRQPRVACLGLVLGERAARARQQLHARRRRQQRNLAADGRHLPERRRTRRVQDADLHVLGRVRTVARRRRQSPDQVRHQQVSTAAASSSTATTRSMRTTFSTTAPAAPNRTSRRTSSVARSAAR